MTLRFPPLARALVARAVLARAVLAGALTAGLLTAPAGAAAAPVLTLQPRSLERGADPAVPYIRGDVLLDGARRVPMPGRGAVLVGASGSAYVVWTSDGGRAARLWRVAADGDATLLLRTREAYGAVLASEGHRLVVPRTRVEARRTVLSVHDAVSGALDARYELRGFATVLDVDDGSAVVGTSSPARTVLLDLSSGARQRLSRSSGYQADLSADRLATFTDDPYDGGCSAVSTISDPGLTLSESCVERVTEFSPDGRRVALVDILTDGLGPDRVTVRTVGGRRLATYDAPFYFGMVTWETKRALLLETHGRRSALVRCIRAACERASRLTVPPQLRAAPAFRLPGQPASRP